MTQQERILAALRLEKRCGTDFLRWGIPRYSARIGELRAAGYEIITEPCRLHQHDTHQFAYSLVTSDQQVLFA